MSTPAGERCSERSLAAGESLTATATPATQFLLVEVPGAWPRDVSGGDGLPAEMRETAPADERPAGRALRSNVAQLERRMIAEALERVRWNKARASHELGLSYPTLLSKIRTLKIERRRGA